MVKLIQKTRIGTRLLIGFGMIIVLIAMLSLNAFNNVGSIFGQVDNYAKRTYPNSNHLWAIRRNMLSVECNLFRTIAMDGAAKDAKQLYDTTVNDLSAIFDEIAAFRLTAQQSSLDIDKMESLIKALQPIVQKVIVLAQADNDVDAMKVMNDEFSPAFQTAATFTISIFDQQAQRGNEQYATAVSVRRSSYIATFVMLGACVIVAIIIALLITESITKPLREARDAAKAMEQGHLDVDIPYTSRDEVGEVAQSLRQSTDIIRSYIADIDRVMGQLAGGDFAVQLNTVFVGDFINIQSSIERFVSNISETLAQFKMSADQVAQGADQVSGSAQALAQGATEQASSVEELSASITEISSQVGENANNSVKASGMAESAVTAITSSNAQMQQLMAAMNNIHIKSSEISKIIKTIEDIAFQTNILALNASVEAARAGEAGRGFNVVAEEVRNLAGKSADAAKNTTQLIEDSVASIDEGVRLAAVTAQDMLGAVDSVEQTTHVIAEITKASHEQAVSLAQVTIGIDQIAAVVAANSATSEESAAASQELSSQANVLNMAVSRFKLHDHFLPDIAVHTPKLKQLPNQYEHPHDDVLHIQLTGKY